jgi:hypothetical protein
MISYVETTIKQHDQHINFNNDKTYIHHVDNYDTTKIVTIYRYDMIIKTIHDNNYNYSNNNGNYNNDICYNQ